MAIENKGCSVDGCDNKHHGKGYCRKHYQRLARSGRLDKGVTLSYEDDDKQDPAETTVVHNYKLGGGRSVASQIRDVSDVLAALAIGDGFKDDIVSSCICELQGIADKMDT
jgi:hypothetical protein